MIVRLVKMTFKEGKGDEFADIFHHAKNKIRDFRGCIFLEALRDTENPDQFFTYSVWSSEADLDRYRDSEVFKETWSKAKAMFAKDPEAYSTKRIDKA